VPKSLTQSLATARRTDIEFTRQLSAAVKVNRRLIALIRRNWAADDSALLAKLV